MWHATHDMWHVKGGEHSLKFLAALATTDLLNTKIIFCSGYCGQCILIIIWTLRISNFFMTPWAAKNLGFVALAVVCLAVSAASTFGDALTSCPGKTDIFLFQPCFYTRKCAKTKGLKLMAKGRKITLLSWQIIKQEKISYLD